jgi:DNA-binding NarL/FixJ family response regulator
VTQEFSPDIVREALGLGASGYVLKNKIQRDLLAAVITVLEGKQFVSSELSG